MSNHEGHTEYRLSFWRKYVFSVDHKVIGIQFLFTTLFFFLVGGVLALLLRWQLAFPGKPMPVLGQLFPESMMVGGIMPAFTESIAMPNSSAPAPPSR